MHPARLLGVAGALLLGGLGLAQAQTTLTIATVNNNDMVVMQQLSPAFEKLHPDIKLNWVVLEENVLRQRVTTDIATHGGQFDVLTIGTYEVPIWGRQNWLMPFANLPAGYDESDLLKPIREGLSYQGKLYALPFYGESSMTYYRKDLFQKAGLTMPANPTYKDVEQAAAKLNNPSQQLYGVCLRGKPGWGENMAFITTMVNTFGGEWFNDKWQPQIDTPPWHNALTFYVNLLKNYGPPGAVQNGFNENLALFANGHCGMWVDATVAAGMLFDKKESKVADELGWAQAPVDVWPKGSNWLWSWALAVPSSSKKQQAAAEFITWATSKQYIDLVAQNRGWVSVPPGTRESTYANPNYQQAAPFAPAVLKAIQTADPIHDTKEPKPYIGVQYADIPQFQALGTTVGQMMAAALTGQMSVDQALKQAQATAERTMRQSGYLK